MVRPIDAIDRTIIASLQKDSRMPSAEIARQVGVAERTVRARIDRLVEDNVIQLVAILRPRSLGYNVVADVFLEVELDRIQEVARHLATLEEVSYVGLTTGDRDISLQLFASNVDALFDYVTEHLNTIDGVLRSKTFVIPRVIKSVYQWGLPSSLPENGNDASASSNGQRRHRQTAATGSEVHA